MVGVAILGVTGSIGNSALKVCANDKTQLNIKLISCHSNIDKALEYKRNYNVEKLVVTSNVSKIVESSAEIYYGADALCDLIASDDIDIVVAGITGFAGLKYILAAIKAKKRIILANKEALICGGHLFLEEVKRYGAELLPCDSEHNAIFQCLLETEQQLVVSGRPDASKIKKIWLTASGGPLFGKQNLDLNAVSVEQACRHPNWSMGKKISVDSATLMNKGLEVIEACILFGLDLSQLEVVIHPSSTVHSMVSFNDGSTLAQLGVNSMQIPIHYAINWPNRKALAIDNLQLSDLSKLEFFPVDNTMFPCLDLALNSYKSGLESCIILNSANEVSVQSFLNGEISFANIYQYCQQAVSSIQFGKCQNFEDIEELDKYARIQVRAMMD